VALTFDDGPSPETTPRTLTLLDQLGLRATFFLLGTAVAGAPGLAAEIAGRGHEVACHGMVHDRHLLRSPGWVINDTAAAVALLDGLGLRPSRYRPPFGQASAATLGAARRGVPEEVGVDGVGAEGEQGRDVVQAPHAGGAHEDAGAPTQGAVEGAVHGAEREEGVDRGGAVREGEAVVEDKESDALAHRPARRLADRLEGAGEGGVGRQGEGEGLARQAEVVQEG
jgi:hypothetical protein